jgi:hypothetical protein
MNNDPKGFLRMVQEWPCDIYSLQSIINVLEEKERMGEIVDNDLMVALGVLYTHDKQYDKTLSIYLHLGTLRPTSCLLLFRAWECV